ncbi:MAG TPA: amidohydrolase family protein [Thermoanaerobaculia bacterium]|nr:amidohydrolase family protein [Thermoanaerobaculia bacterium]
MLRISRWIAVGLLLALPGGTAWGVEGEGPFPRLILRGATLVDGTGAPPFGPVDVVIQNDRITALVPVGSLGMPISPEARPKLEGGREIDLTGMWVLPGFVDLYAHPMEPVEYYSKLWLSHGITTVRDPSCREGFKACAELRRNSQGAETVTPRVEPFIGLGVGGGPAADNPEGARAWVAEAKRAGISGVRFRGQSPGLIAAAISEARKLGLPTSAHHYPGADALDTSGWGLTFLEHWHGIPEAMLADRTVIDYPLDYNEADEGQRFARSGRLWRQAAAPGSERWNRVIDDLVARGLTLVPTLSLYEANRDLMRAVQAEWHERYTLPALWDRFKPDRLGHAAHWFDWTTADEAAWRENYRLWMAFLNDYKNRGGRVAVGTDAGFMYNLHGFSFVREMELLQEAGFHPLEVVRAATLLGAETLGRAGEIGSIEPGKLADLVVVPENPLRNLKVLYGTGALKVGLDNRPSRVGGVRYTIKGGVVYDAERLRADVRRIVEEAKAREGRGIVAPGLEEPPAREIQQPARVEGLWEGIILYDPAQVELETTVEIARDAQGSLAGTIDLPSQRMKYHPLKDFKVDGRKVSFTFYRNSERRGPDSPFIFDGEISADGRVMEGIFAGFYNEEKGTDRVPFRFERIGEPGDERPEPVQPALLSLSPSSSELRDAFNRDADAVRILILISPT